MSNIFWNDIDKILNNSLSKMNNEEIRNLSCGICRKIIKDAVQIICGCKFCRYCIENYLNDGNKICPCLKDGDCLKVKLTSMEDVHIEKETNRRILQLKVQCPNNECNYEAELRDMSEHYKSCNKINIKEFDLENEIFVLQKDNENLAAMVLSLTHQRHLDSERLNNLERHVQDLNKQIQQRSESNLYETYIWRLDKYSEIISERKNVYSDPFYVMKYGYKVRLALTPGGNDGLYLGIYFQLMKGEYDSLLSWPFTFTVTFTILSQKLPHEDHVHILDFPLESEYLKSYVRPYTDINPGYGAIQFFNIASFSSSDIYLLEDTFFIKFSVSKV